ncbi:MAG: DUF1990 family protein [Verrucomicrobiota bacterium]
MTFPKAKTLTPNFTNAHSLPEKTSTIALNVPGPICKWHTDSLFDYDVFPSTIIRYEAEWRTECRKVRVGDIILQRAMIPPLLGFGLCLEFAVRISRLIKEEKRLGFAYETLTGHAERGISEFYFEEQNGSLSFTIHTYSEPGHWTSRLGKHIATLPYQAWCTRRALNHVKTRFHQSNPAS